MEYGDQLFFFNEYSLKPRAESAYRQNARTLEQAYTVRGSGVSSEVRGDSAPSIPITTNYIDCLLNSGSRLYFLNSKQIIKITCSKIKGYELTCTN